MNKTISRHIIHFLLGTLIFLIVCPNNRCCPQTPFIIGGQGTWIKKGRPFIFNGAKINIWDNTCVDGRLYGVNISLVLSKIRAVNGFSFAILFSLCDQMNGFEFSLVNRTTTLKGMQIGIMNQRTHFLKPSMKEGNHGLQLGVLNATFSNFGIQLGLYNESWSEHKGISIGVININSLSQIGLINIKNELDKGIQLGVINYRKGNKWYAKVLPIINIRIKNKEVDDWQ